jgi:signal transduction histidine kinase
MVSALHSTASPHYSLYDVLSLCESEFRVGHKPELRVVSMGEPREINPVVRDEIYRICREAVANAFRHAKAQMIQVKIQYEKVGLTIDIVDDGGGMDEKTNQFGRMGHFGLRGMRAHARRIGAEFSVTSVLGGGTHVRLRARIAQGWKERMQASFAAWPRPLEDFLSRIKAKVGDGFEQ